MKITCDLNFRLLAAFGLSLAASACSSSSDNTDTSSTSTTEATGSSTAPTTGGTSDSTGPASSATTDDTGSTSTTTDSTTNTTTTTAGVTSDPTTGAPTEATGSSSGSSTGEELSISFFVSSTGSTTADLGGLDGADKRCQDLADAVGAGGKTWRAYLSAEKGPDDQPVHAKDRIGAGPWYNAKLVMLAADLADLHNDRPGDAELFLDENGEKVPGQWEGSPDPNQHDILTGTNVDGTVAVGKTCADWTSDDPALFAQVGHSDGLGPMMSDAPQYRSWNSVHESGGCNDTAPKGGAGRVYCFAID